MTRRCDHWTEAGYCTETKGVRYYGIGWRCPTHRPRKRGDHE